MTKPYRSMKGVMRDDQRPVKRRRNEILFGLFLVLSAAFVFAGCIGEPQEPPVTETPPSVLVDYVRVGGIAGVNDHLVIFDNGQAIYSTNARPGEFELTSAELDRVRDVFAISGFESLSGTYPAPTPGADYFTYRITYENQTVITQTTGVPDQLMPVISYLDQIIAEQSTR